MALVNTGNDPWIMEHDACEKLAREIMEQLTNRDREEKSSKGYDGLNGKIRIRLKQYSTEIKQLNEKLNLASYVSSLTAEERERRKRQVEALQSREHKLLDHFNNRSGIYQSAASNTDTTRSNLLATRAKIPVFADLGTTSWGDVDDPEAEEVNSLPVPVLRQQQQEMLKEQDQGLENLSKVISKQKEIATVISNEVDEHNVILDDIADNMDRVSGRIRYETDMVRVIGRKDKTWGYWVIIIVLFIIIVVVAVV